MLNSKFQVAIFLCGTTFFILILIGLIILISNLYQKKQLNYFLLLNQIQIEHSNTLLATKLEIQEETVKNISKELHDNLGQKLSLLKLNLLTTEINMNNCSYLKTANEIVNETIADLRDLSKMLNSDSLLKDGLVKALENQSERLRNTKKYKVELSTEGTVCFLHADTELLLFRISQEGINNIIKHSKADTIKIKLSFSSTTLELMIWDNGVGLPLGTNNSNGSGLGIKNMEQRTKALQGKFFVKAALGEGTSIIIQIPIQHEQSN